MYDVSKMNDDQVAEAAEKLSDKYKDGGEPSPDERAVLRRAAYMRQAFTLDSVTIVGDDGEDHPAREFLAEQDDDDQEVQS